MKRESREQNKRAGTKLSSIEALTDPGAFVEEMTMLERDVDEEETRHTGSTNAMFGRLYRNAIVAKESPEALLEFLRQPYWSNRAAERPNPDDIESILQALIRFTQRNKPKEKARRTIYTWFSAGRELLARDAKLVEIQTILEAEGGISGLRDAFKERRRQNKQDDPTKIVFPMRLPIPMCRDLHWERFNEGEWHVVFEGLAGKYYIPESFVKNAKRV